LKGIKEELRRRRHRPILEQGGWLRQVVTGFFNYHAVPTNARALESFRYHVTDLWRRSLRRRSQWTDSLGHGLQSWLMTGSLNQRILHPWPSVRFAVKHPRWVPYAGIPLIRMHPNATNMSCTWRWRTSLTPAPRSKAHRPTASSSDRPGESETHSWANQYLTFEYPQLDPPSLMAQHHPGPHSGRLENRGLGPSHHYPRAKLINAYRRPFSENRA
jgi:hypothetical protein